MGERTKLCDYTNTPNDQFITRAIATPKINAESYEVSPSLLNLITREQFGGSAMEDASMHLHDFVKICDMQKFKNVESDILKLKLFPFSLRGKAKEWLHSLPSGSINSWADLKEDFIKKYYPPVKILQNRNNILSFRQNENEHVAMAWDSIKLMLRTCPSHGVNEWTILHSFYNGLNYMSRNILDSAAGGAFMSKTIVEAKNILESILQNYSQWHTDRAPNPSKKVNSIEETNDLSSKMDTILALLNKPSVENVPLQELVGNNSENIDVNFIRNYGNNGYGNNNYNSYNKPPYVPNKYASSGNVSSDLENTIRSFISTQKELNKEFISKFEKQDALFERVDQLTKEVSSLKSIITAQKHEETIKYCQEVINKSWEHIHEQERVAKESTGVMKEVEVEEVKMLNEVKDPLLDLENCSLHELISILQKFASDPSINTNQAGFGSYIANHVLKEKIARYNQEAMIPPKLGDMWIPKVLVTIGKETHHAILDLGSSVSVLYKELYEVLELKNLEKCSIELALADDSIKHALGKVSDVMVELHMTFVPVDFLIMDMGSKTSSPIILGRPFLRTTGAIIDSKEGNVKFQFPHKKCMEHFPRKREPPKFKLPHELRPQ